MAEDTGKDSTQEATHTVDTKGVKAIVVSKRAF